MVIENEDIMIDQNKTINDNDEKICFIITVFEVYDAVTASGRK